MITRRYLEKESTVLGLPMQQVGMLVLATVLLILFSRFIRILLPDFKWFNHMVVLTLTSAYIGLKYAAQHDHPTFITSNLSYYLQQKPKRFLPLAHSVVDVSSESVDLDDSASEVKNRKMR